MTCLRRSRWVDFAAVLAICSSLIMTIKSVKAQSIGTCEDTTPESNASCVDVDDCASSICQEDLDSTQDCEGTCTPDPCTAKLYTDIKKVGRCENTWWDNGCTWCSRYWCAKVHYYQSMDSNGQCQTKRCYTLASCTAIYTAGEGCCPPTVE